jgi:hypothetical protein
LFLGVLWDLNTTFKTSQANFTVCMYLHSDIALDGSFQVYDLAYSDEDYSKWTPMNAQIWFNAEGLICGILPAPYPTTLTTIFPVWRYPPLPPCPP